MESEKELLDDIFRGSRDAMHRLYERYVGHAMAVALRYVPLREDAEDVVQDSFIKVFAAIPNFQYRGEGSLKGWLLLMKRLLVFGRKVNLRWWKNFRMSLWKRNRL